MRKHSIVEDELPLTHYSSPTRSITQDTRSRFDDLLRTALKQEKGKIGKTKHAKKTDNRGLEEFSPEHPDKSTVTFISEKPKISFRDRGDSRLEKTGEVEILSSSDDDVVTQNPNKNNSSKLVGNIHLPSLKDSKNLELSTRAKHVSPKKLAVVNEKTRTQRQSAQYFDSSSDDDEKDLNIAPRRRLSYTIHKTEEASKLASPSLEVSPQRPIPVPRKRREAKSSTVENSPEIRHPKVSAESSQDIVNDDREPAPPLYSTTAASYENLEKDGGPIPKVRRKIKQQLSEDIELQNLKASYEEITPSRRTPKQSEARETELTYDEIVGIYVHRSDFLQTNRLVQHPLVKVYIIETATGEYLKKSDPKRSVAYFNESESVDFISPLMTQEFDFQARRSVIPSWEELIVFNEDMNYIMNPDTPVIIFFEILNSVSFSVASSQYKRLGTEGGWHRIAWAFLKPLGANGHQNIGMECRLQLYKPSAMRKTSSDSCEVYAWWRHGSWQKYPSTLYVTVKPIRPPSNLPPVLRSRLAMQGEHSTRTQQSPEGTVDNHGGIVLPSVSGSVVASNAVIWSRLPTQSCKVPNTRALILSTTSRGCFVLKFSCSGRYLACATVSKDEYTILVYTIPGGTEYVHLAGHQGLVYDLNWSDDDSLLLSASADCTACIWTIATDRKSQLVQMLPHPAFVYSARFSPVSVGTLVTACSDHVIRIWSRASNASVFELREELEEHTGFVTALCFDKDGTLVSGDSVGRILVWQSRNGKAISHRELKVRELHDVVINCLSLHPGGQRLLVHSRDSLLRMVDLTTASVIQWFHGGLNYRVQTYSAMSPCGGLVFAASEDGSVHVWNSDTGDQVAMYAGLQFPDAASGVDYHPFEHMAAFCSATSSSGILLCSYDKSSDGSSLGLQLLGKITESNAGRGDESLELHQITTQSLNEVNISSLSRHADSFLTSTMISTTPTKNDEMEKDMKLKHIIERMDKVLLTTLPCKSIATAEIGDGQDAHIVSARDRRRIKKASA